MALTSKYKLKDGFEVSKLMQKIDIDFVYSLKDERLTLLNQDMFGVFDRSLTDSQKENTRMIVIDNKKMIMEVYNIDSDEMDAAIIKV